MAPSEPDQPQLQSCNRQLQTYLTRQKTNKAAPQLQSRDTSFSPPFSLPVGEVLRAGLQRLRVSSGQDFSVCPHLLPVGENTLVEKRN